MAHKKAHEHVGSGFEEFLRQDKRLEAATTLALKRVREWEFQQAMERSTSATPRLSDGSV
jgi:hypothetical protein